jgi:hypothetical protein
MTYKTDDNQTECGDIYYINTETLPETLSVDTFSILPVDTFSILPVNTVPILSTNTNNCDKLCEKLCNKCWMKKQSNNSNSKIEIFNIINDIVFCSVSMPEVYERMDKLIIKQNKWFEINEDGLTVFHWIAWYISTKIKKYSYIKPRVYAFFQKVFSDNTVRSVFGNNMINKIINLGTKNKQSHTILYHLVRYCENSNDIFYMRLYNLLIERGSKQLTDDQIKEIKSFNTDEEILPLTLKYKVSSITDKYKLEENKIVKDIETKCQDYKLDKCFECDSLIDYTKEIPKIIKYAENNKCDFLLNSIWAAYYQRKLLNTVFDKYYDTINAQSNLNMIHKRHTHILELYSNNLNQNLNLSIEVC